MDTQRWRCIAAIFDEVVEAPPRARAALLEKLCAGDAEVRREVEALLAADASAASFDHGMDSARNQAAVEWAQGEDDESMRVGERIGPWRVLRELGRGGMGVVWLAERADGQFEQRAALKLIKRGMDSEAVIARFLRERQILARLEHPHIARLLDGGIAADGRPYFAMEYVDGRPLLRYCTGKSIKLEKRIKIFLDICAAVQFAHGQLVVHRDIKPSNILVTANGSTKLLDFGIAKLLDDAQIDVTVDAGHRPLTPAYAAPEQLRGEPIGTAADIYALGGVLYELLCGRHPLDAADASTPEAALRTLETGHLLAPSKAAAADATVPARLLRGDLDTIVLKAMQREPSRRYATVAAFADDLQRFLAGQPISARRDRAGYRARKFISRHRLGAAASTLGVLALVAALAFALWQAREKTHEAAVSQQVTTFLVGLFKGADPALSRGTSVSAQDLLDQGTERLRSDTHIEPSVRARLLQTVATTYTDLGLYDRALPLAQQALALRRRDPARVDAEVAESLDELGRILRLKADYAQAEPLLRDALTMRRALLPADDPAIIESLDHLAALMQAQGNFKDADALLTEAVHSAQRHFGNDATTTAQYLDDYAANLDDMGKRQDALKFYRQALAIREKNLGANDAEVATSLLNLGVHLDESGDFDEAAPLLERSVAIRKKIYGASHPLVGFADLGLAGVYEDLGRLDDAEKLAQDALSIFRRTLPADHPKISEALNLLVTLRVARRDFAGAVPLAQEVLTRYTKTLGEDHPDTLTAKNNLAYVLLHVGRSADAEALLRDVLARKRGDNGQLVDATDGENLASALMQEGKFAEAVTYERRAVDIQRQREGEISGNTAVALRQLGIAEALNGADVEAERDLRAALATGEKLQTAHGMEMYQWRLPLADYLVGCRRCEEAKPLLDAVIAELKPRMPLQDTSPLQQAQMLQGYCSVAAGTRTEGESMLTAARKGLRVLPGIEMDLYPTAQKLLSASPR